MAEEQQRKMSVTEFLQTVRAGGAVEELRDAIEETVAAVKMTQKPGKVTLNIVIKPSGLSQVFIQDDIKTAKPIPNKEDTLFYITDQGGLTRRDPNQLSFEQLEGAQK